ncbi:MAG: FGGY-family carbohydrate kinase [Adhaeribacter sp.]
MVPCIAVFDIGKTNKKCILFDHYFNILHEIETRLAEITDDDGEPCEDVHQLTSWLLATWKKLEDDERFEVLGVNFTTYGASFVHLDAHNKPATPLYSYLKPYPRDLEEQFYGRYGDKLSFATLTASPNLGMLNSGLQLYWLKYKKPEVFNRIKTTLHLPQYCSFLFMGNKVSEFTSIGCHTALWNFETHSYHRWVYEENILPLLPRITGHDNKFCTTFRHKRIPAGIGLHDSSSALIPYLKKYTDPFLLLSTGTWGITLNPFSKQILSREELQRDCLHYLTYNGKPVKASRVFIGNEHEEQVKKLAAHYGKPADYYRIVPYLPAYAQALVPQNGKGHHTRPTTQPKLNIDLDLALYPSYEEAYHALMRKITEPQVEAIRLAAEYRQEEFTYLLVDGGFGKNKIFIHLLQESFPGLSVIVSDNTQGTALGAAMMMNVWESVSAS